MNGRGTLVYLILLAAQVLLGNFLNLGPYLVVCILPVLVMSLPITWSDISVMLAAFLSALAVDFFTHGILGLSVLGLVPVAFARRWAVSLVFGAEVHARGEDLSVQRQGIPKLALVILLATAVYFAIYVWVDAAGTRSLGFNTLRWIASTLLSTLAELPLLGLLNGREEGRWK